MYVEDDDDESALAANDDKNTAKEDDDDGSAWEAKQPKQPHQRRPSHRSPSEQNTLCKHLLWIAFSMTWKMRPVRTRDQNMLKNVPEYQINTPCHFIDLRVPGLRSKRERDWAQPRRSV